MSMKPVNRIISAFMATLMLICSLSPLSDVHAEDLQPIVDNANGTAQITYTVTEEQVILVLVDVPKDNIDTSEGSNEAERYYYKLNVGDNKVDVPLTRGPGEYKIRICEKKSDGKAVVKKSAVVELTDKPKVFDIANFVVDYQTADKFIKKAKSLTKNCKTESAKVKKIYDYIIKNYAYDYELLEQKTAKGSYYNPDNLETFTRQLGICYDIAALLAAMLRSVGIESRVVTGHTPLVKEYHAWNQIYDSKKDSWYTVDATVGMTRYKRGIKDTMIKKDSDYSDIVYIY